MQGIPISDKTRDSAYSSTLAFFSGLPCPSISPDAARLVPATAVLDPATVGGVWVVALWTFVGDACRGEAVTFGSSLCSGTCCGS